MSDIKDAQIDLLWKKIAYSRSRTGQNTNAFEETYVSSVPVSPNNIWTDAPEIPQDPSAPIVFPEVLEARNRVSGYLPIMGCHIRFRLKKKTAHY